MHMASLNENWSGGCRFIVVPEVTNYYRAVSAGRWCGPAGRQRCIILPKFAVLALGLLWLECVERGRKMMSLLSRDWRSMPKRYTRRLEQWMRKWDLMVPDSYSGSITGVLLPVLGGFLTLFLLWGVLRTAHIRTVHAAAQRNGELKQVPASLNGAKEGTDGIGKLELVHLDDDAEVLSGDKAELADSRSSDDLPSEHGGGKSEAGRKKKKAGRLKERRKGKNELPAVEAGKDFGSSGEALEENGERASRSRKRKASNPPRMRKKRKPQE